MFGIVTANVQELTEEEKNRYAAVYCGICRSIRNRSSGLSRLGLSYDMAFLALLLMSLYEPEEEQGEDRCVTHPVGKRAWVDNSCVEYAADMNVVLAYYKCLDDWQDEGKNHARLMAGILEKHVPRIRQLYPRQTGAIETCITQLSALEKENCPHPDEPANCFGNLMAELMVCREDLWSDTLRQLGFSLGRFIYLSDAAADYPEDEKKNRYNPFLAMGTGEDYDRWESYLVLAMASCTEAFERLPLVQDKQLLNNILYSGVWASFRAAQKKASGGKR